MTSSNATLILWTNSWGDSQGERLVSRAQEANVLDLVEKSESVAEIDRVIVVTSSPALIKALGPFPVILETDPHLVSTTFGEKIRSIIEEYGIETVLYFGGGSGVFMSVEDMAGIARVALSSPGALWVNNFFSTDFAGFNTAQALPALDRCQRDNYLGRVLGRETEMKVYVLPPGLMTRFDIDSPADLGILKIYRKKAGRHLEEFLSRVILDSLPLYEIMDVLVNRDRRILIIGRVPLDGASFFDRETACHVNFYIEGRGMEGREKSKGDHMWSLIGESIEEMGLSRFFDCLAGEADAVIMDTRVCFRHLRLHLSRQDRFFSDLLWPHRIEDGFLRSFTRRAIESPVPLLLGGHSMVSGGLYALGESAWWQTESPLRRDVEDIPEDSWVKARLETVG
ncbi:MAG: hypothetical protein GTN81_08675 [Proteobacteria bacterium]|nr:hypothetical protein [Pseudomonadota bacterium]